MTTQANPSSKPARIVGYALSILVSIPLVFSAVMKLLADEFLVESMSAIHLLPAMKAIAIIEVLVVILFWLPKTMKIGFFLCCFYIGGIISAELIAMEGSGIPIPGVPLAVLLVVGTYLRRKELFT